MVESTKTYKIDTDLKLKHWSRAQGLEKRVYANAYCEGGSWYLNLQCGWCELNWPLADLLERKQVIAVLFGSGQQQVIDKLIADASRAALNLKG